ncbi:hypothetical protein OAL21_02935 [Akkermansiaceae bacterium]|nr:hypothetical protein [Akkermansiaceae bacterium]
MKIIILIVEVENFRNIGKISPLVPLLSISDLTLPISCGILEVDVEGEELDVLRVFKEIIVTQKPLIIREVLSAYEEINEFRFNA